MMTQYLETLGNELCNLAKHCEEIVKNAYVESEVTLPVDICKVANFLKIDVVSGEINIGKIKYVTELQFEIDKESNAMKQKIVVDEKFHGTHFFYNSFERFAIAREIGKIIINSQDYNQITECSTNRYNMLSIPYPIISSLTANSEDFLYEICAMFILFPMKEFLETLNFYSLASEPIINGNMIESIVKKAHIPYYQFVNNYTLMKLCAHQYIENAYQDDDKQLVQKYANLLQ